MKLRNFFLVLVPFALSFFFVWLPSTNSNASSVELAFETDKAKTAVFDDLDDKASRSEDLQLVEVIDLLSNESLEGQEIYLRIRQSRLPLASGQILPSDWRSGHFVIIEHLQDNQRVIELPTAAARFNAGVLAIPYYAGVRISLDNISRKSFSGDGHIVAYNFSKNGQDVLEAEIQREGLFNSSYFDLLPLLISSWRHQFGKVDSLSSPVLADTETKVFLSPQDRVFLAIDHPLYQFYYSENVPLRRGELVEWRPKVVRRPIFVGRLTTHWGEPAKNCPVKISMSMTGGLPDHNPKRGGYSYGTAILQLPDGIEYVLSKTVQTNENGEFRINGLVASGYALTGFHGDGCAEEFLYTPDLNDNGECYVELVAEVPDMETRTFYAVLKNGDPLVGAKINSAIRDDKWHRRFEHRYTDEKGRFTIPWLKDEPLGVWIRKKRFMHRALFVEIIRGQTPQEQKFVIPEDRIIETYLREGNN